jgi:glycosyltransferase involved in cell wall biosynthesis
MSGIHDPRISVIIPVYNGERYLAAAIESALAQTRKPIEIIVVDDGSTDGSANVARRFVPSVKYDLQLHAGPGGARNRGVALAQGDYLAFLDADDLWVKEKLEVQMAAFDVSAPPDAVFGYVEQFVSPDLPAEQAAKMDCPAEAAPARLPGTILIRREAFKKVGCFSTALRVGEFVEWYARATELAIKDVIIPRVVLRRRIHATNSGFLHRDARRDYVRVVKAALDRRRQRVGETGL